VVLLNMSGVKIEGMGLKYHVKIGTTVWRMEILNRLKRFRKKLFVEKINFFSYNICSRLQAVLRDLPMFN